jgi:ParB-like chromosome segregation protein Spo0J
MKKLLSHRFADLFPMMGEPELEALSDDIKQNGLRQPIVLHEGAILDGRNRFQACSRAGIEPEFTEHQGDDASALALVISLNSQRRDLTPAQRALAAARTWLLNGDTKDKGKGRRSKDHESQTATHGIKELAKQFRTSDNTIRQARDLLLEAPDLADQVQAGISSLAAATELLEARRSGNASLEDGFSSKAVVANLRPGTDEWSSVQEGDDAPLLEKMLDFYPRKVPEQILDATVGRGTFWVGSSRPVIRMDIDPRYRPDVVGDNTAMPFADRSFDVVVYDPPHVPNQGKDKSKDFTTRFGLGGKSAAANGCNFSHQYPPFLAEAYRVLRAEGILLCKIADYVHNHRTQWAFFELKTAAEAAGFLACDYIIKERPATIEDPKWKEAHHARKRHCFWLVCRKSTKCE